MIAAASKRQILSRMLVNLAGIYGRQGDLPRSLDVLERLAILEPSNPRIARDLVAAPRARRRSELALHSRSMSEPRKPSEPFSPDSVARQLDYCTFCPKMCRHACPVSTASGRETYIPQVKMDRMNQLRLGRSAWTTESTDPLWACTGCRHCTMYCDHGNEPGLVLLTGRAAAVAHGVPHPALTNYSERFRAREQRLSAQLATMFPDQLATEGELGYWPGCDAIDKGAGDIAAALALFERVGLEDVKIVDTGDRRRARGYPLLAAGHRDLFRWHAGRVAASLRGFRKVAINCSACLYAMRSQYAAEGVNLRTEVVSLAEVLAPAAQNLACSLIATHGLLPRPLLPRALQQRRSSSRGARSRSSPRSASWAGTRPTPSAAAAAACCPRRCRWSPIRWRSAASPRSRPAAAAWSSPRARPARSCSKRNAPAVGRGREPRHRDGAAVGDRVHATDHAGRSRRRLGACAALPAPAWGRPRRWARIGVEAAGTFAQVGAGSRGAAVAAAAARQSFKRLCVAQTSSHSHLALKSPRSES